MTAETVLSNARLVLAGEDVPVGTALVRDGTIAAVDSGASGLASAVDLEGDYLLPGLVELHTDNMEKHLTPRPRVTWPIMPAILAHDADMAAAGITTAFDALRIGDYGDGKGRAGLVQATFDGIEAARRQGLLRAEHRLHLRCEICTPDAADTFERFVDATALGLVSVMDHTPGQRQFRDVGKWRVYHSGRYGIGEAEMDAYIETKLAAQQRYSLANRARIVERARGRGLMLASHDDTTVEDVEEAAAAGFTIAEFPTTREAAEAAHAKGLATIAGAPNLVRGGSHSGNIAAAELAEAGLLDALSSDYVPISLLHAAFLLADAVPLPRAVATVSLNPARMVGLDDRGEIAAGRRADLVRARRSGDVPVVRAVWRAGERIL
jgi:alpha-D-ribose 1-methylphosphonate 5-triphosphate diphosphatase